MSTRRQFLVSLAAAAAYAHGMSADSVKDRFRNGRMSPEDVKALATGGVDRLMTEMLPVAREFARPPLSNFHVGAVALGTSGALYLGANFEVARNALNQAIHGEQSALANAYGHHEPGIAAIAVTAAPCGHCRQFLNEVTNGSKIRVIVNGQPERTVAQLLPDSFGPEDLGVKAAMFSGTSAKLTVDSKDALVQSAAEAASRAYAPYTKALSGCAIAMKSGRSFAGSYLENAAFNPSLSPLQAALVQAVFANEDLAAIKRVVLVEQRGATISQRPATEAVLSVLAPSARLEVVPI